MIANTKLSSFGSELLLLRLPRLVPLAALALDVGMATIVATLLFFLPSSWGKWCAWRIRRSVHSNLLSTCG